MKEMDTESTDPNSFCNRQHGRIHTVFKLSERQSLPGTSGTTPMMATNLVKREERKSGCENNGASRSTLPPFEETNTAADKDTHSLSTSTLDVVSPLRKTSGFTAPSPTWRSSACGFLRKGEVDLRTSNVSPCSPSSSLQEILGSSPSKTPQFHARDNESKVLFDHSGIVRKPETSSLVSSLSLTGAGPSAKRDHPTVGNSQPKKPLPKYVHRPKSKIEDIVRNLRVQKSLTDDTFSFTKSDISSKSPSSERTARDILDQSISGKTNHDCLQDKKECASESVSDRCINNEGTTDKSVPTLISDKCCLPRTSPIESACVNRDGQERVNLCVEIGAVDKKALDKTSAQETNNLTKPTTTEPAHTAATKVSRKEDCHEGRCEEVTKTVLEETGVSPEPKDQSKVEETARKCLNESSQKSAGSSSGKVSPSLTGDSPVSVTGSRDSSSKSISKTCSRKSNDLNARSSNRETKAASSKAGLNGQLSLQDAHENMVDVCSPSSRWKDQSKKRVHSVPNKKQVSAKSDCEVSNVVGQRSSSKPSRTDSSIETRTPSSRSDKGKHTKSKTASGNDERKQLKSESITKALTSCASKSAVQETVNLKTCNDVPDSESEKSDPPKSIETKVQKYNSLFPDYLEDISSESDFDDDRVGESSKPTNVFGTTCLGDELEDISSAPDSMDEDSAATFDMADKLKQEPEIYDAKSQGDELKSSSSDKDSSSLHESSITVGNKDFHHNRTNSSSETPLSSLPSDVQSLSLQDSVISEDSCEDSRVKCVQLLKELMLTVDDAGIKICSNRNSTSSQPCLPCRLPLTKVSQALEIYSKTSKSSCRSPKTTGDMIKPLNMLEISDKESTPDISESTDTVTLSGMVSEVVDSTDTAGTLAGLTEMPCSIAEPSTPVILLCQESSSDIAGTSIYFNGVKDSSERTGILEDPFVAPNTVPNISETPATLTDLSEITDVLADLSESSDPLMELSETSNSLVELPESADALAVLPAISVSLDCSSEISSSLADLPITADSLENLSGTDNIHPSLPEISDSLGCSSEISSVIEDLHEATNSLDSQPDETINVLPLLPEMSDTLDSSCEAVNILTNLPETVDPLGTSPGITEVLSVLPKISNTVADLSETTLSFPVSSKGTDCFPDKSQTGDISFDSSKADGIREEPETMAPSNNNSESRSPFMESSSETTAASNGASKTRSPYIESSSETTAASNDASETRSPFIESSSETTAASNAASETRSPFIESSSEITAASNDASESRSPCIYSSSETNIINDPSTSGAEVTKSEDSADIAINISLPLDSLLELPKPAYPVLEEEHKEDERELSSAKLHEEVNDSSSRVHNKESRLLGRSSLASDIENVDHGSPTKLKTPLEICSASPDTKAVVPPEVNNVPPEASATSSDSLLSSDKTNQSRVVSPSNKFLFQIGKEHHMKLDDGQKLFACDICSGVYQRAFSLKRHYLRSHINYRYLTERDISNCGIITGDKMALQSENNTKIRMQNSKITSVSDSESSRDVPVSSTFIEGEVSDLLQDNTRVLSESDVIAKETTSNKSEKPDINEVEDVKTVGALNVLSNPMGLYRCHTCGECFEEKSGLKVHLRNHPIPLSVGPSGESKSFSCTRCNATFSHKNNYLRHCASLAHNKQPVIVASGSKKAFLCLYCNKEFTSVAIRKRHQSRMHQNQKKLKNRRRPQHACPFCPKSKKFRDLSLVMKHCLSEHGDDYHVCTTCPERFLSKQILNEHVKEEHTKLKTKSVKIERPVNNAADNKLPGKEIMEPKGADSVISNSGIEQEELNQLENVPLSERKKNLTVNREGNKEQQVSTENNFRYKCSVCQKMFTNYVNLSRHNRLAHRTALSSKKSKNSSQSSSCTDTLSSPSDGSRSQSPLVTSFVPVNVKRSLPKQSQALPRLVQNTQSNSRLEGTVDERSMDPETLFYSRLSCNIRDNLLNHLDGKLHSQGSVDQCEESVCASLEVDSREESTSQDSNVISMSSLSNMNELLEDDKTNKINSKELSPKRKTGGNTVHKVFWEKYNFPKNYDGRGGGLTSYIKDMSHLDIHTQLTMRQNLQRMNSNSSDSSEDMPLSRMVRSEANDNVINFPAELCLIENVSNKQKSQNSKASSLTSKLTRESRRVTRRTSELEQKEKEAALEREAKSNSSSRRASTEDSDSNTVVLSGEWVRPRSYICAACSARFADLWDLEDHKYSVHPNVWCTHYEFDETSVFGNASGGGDGSSAAPPSLPVDLCPRYLLSDGALQAAKIIPVTVASDSKCTKCGRSFNTLPDLHRHMLECGGDTTWMLTMLVTSPGANNRRNRKWRPFGSRRRRQQGRRGMKRNIPSTPVKIPHYRPRHRGNDSDSIQRMIANLPPKRSTRRVIQFSEDEIKTRSQGTIHSVPFVPNLTRPTYKSGICRSSYGRIISSPDRKHSQALKKRAVSIASGAGSSQRAKARKFLRSQSEGTVARAQATVPLDLCTAGPSTSKGVLGRSAGNITNSSKRTKFVEGAKGRRVARRNKNASANSSVSSSSLTVVEDNVSLPSAKALVVSRGRSIKRLTVSSEVRSLSTGPDTIITRITRNVKRSLSLDQAKVMRKFPQDSIAGLSGGETIELKGKALKASDNVKGKVPRNKTLTRSPLEVSRVAERRSKHFTSSVIETGMAVPRETSNVLSAMKLAILEKSTTITQGMFEVCEKSSTAALRRQTRGNIKVSLEESMIASSDGVVDNPIQCGNCGIKFPNPSACERHKKKCVVNTDHQLCHHCGKSFSYTTHFWKHIKSCRSLLHAASGNIVHNQSIALKSAVPVKDVGKKSTVPKRSISNSPAKRKSSKTSNENLKVSPSFSDTDDRMPSLEKVLPIVDTKRVTRSKKSEDLSDIPVLSPVSDPLVPTEGEGNSSIEEYSKRSNKKGKTIRSVSESRLVEMNRSEVLSKENISDMETLSFDDKDQNPNTVKRSRSLTKKSLKLSVVDGRLHKGTKKESPKRKNRNLSKDYEIPISKLEAQFAEVVNIIDDTQESTSESTAESQDKDDMDSMVIGTKVNKGIHSKERGNTGVDTATFNMVTGELETVMHMEKVGNMINIKHQQTSAVSNESTFLKLLPNGKPMLKDRTASVKKRCRSVPETEKLGQNSENSSPNNALESNELVGNNVRRRRSLTKSLKIEFQALPAPTEYIQPAKLSSQKREASNSSIQEPRRSTKRRTSLMIPDEKNVIRESSRKENFVGSHPRSKSETKVSETSDVESHQFQNIDCLKETSVTNIQVRRRRRSCAAVIESESQPPSADSSRSEKMESPENCGSSTEDSLNTDIQEKVARYNKARFSDPKVDVSQSQFNKHYSPNEFVNSSRGKQGGRRNRSRSSRSSLQMRDGSQSSEATEFDESSVEYPEGDLMNSINSKTNQKRSPAKAGRANLAVLNGFSSVEYSNEQSFESSTEESVDGSLKEEKKYRNRARKLELILSETSQESSEIQEVTNYVQESMQNKRVRSRKVIKIANLNVKTTDMLQLSKDTLLGTTDTAQFNEESTQDDSLNNYATKRQRRKRNTKATKVQLEACDILQYSEFTKPEESQDLFQNHEYAEDINQNSDAEYGEKKIKRCTRPITTGLEVSNLPNSSKSDSEVNILQSNKSLRSVIGSQANAEAIELPFSNTSQSSLCTEHHKLETSDSETDTNLGDRLSRRKVQMKNSKIELHSAQISQSSEWTQLGKVLCNDNPDRDANNDCVQVQRKQNRSRSKGGKAKQQVSNVEVVNVSELQPISSIDTDCKEKVLNGSVKQKIRRRIQPKVSEIELISNTSLSSECTEAEDLKELDNMGEYLDNKAISSNRTNKKKHHPTLGTGYSRNTNTNMKELHQLNEVNFDNDNLKSRNTNSRKSSVYIENEIPFQICASLQDMGNSSPEIKKINRSQTKSPKISQFSGATELVDQSSSLESSLMDEFLDKDSMNDDVQGKGQTSQSVLTTCNTSQISDASQSEKLEEKQNIIESQTKSIELNVLQSPNVMNSVSAKLKKGKRQSRPRKSESALNTSGFSTAPKESLYFQNIDSLNHDLQSEVFEKQEELPSDFGYSQDKTMAGNDKVELVTSGTKRKIKKVRGQNKLFTSQLKPSNIMKLSLQRESENLQDLVNTKLQEKKKKGKSQTNTPGLDVQGEETFSQLDPRKLLGESEVNDVLNSYLIEGRNQAESQLNRVLMSELHGGGLPFQILTGKEPHSVEMSHMDEGRKGGPTVAHDKEENAFTKCKSKIRKSFLQSREIQMVPHLRQEPLELIHHLGSHRTEFTGSPGLEKKKRKKKYRSRTKCVNAKFQIQEIDVDLSSSNLSQPLALDEIIQPIAFQEDDEGNGGMQKETPIKKKIPKFKLQMLGTSLVIQHAENGQLLKTSEVSHITGTVHDEILGSTKFIKKGNKSQSKAVKSGLLMQNANELSSSPVNTEPVGNALSSAGMVKERSESQINPENCEPNMITPVEYTQPVDLEKLSREERFAASMDEIFKCVLGEENSEAVVPVKKKYKRKSQERKFATHESMLEAIEAVVRGSIEMSENCDSNKDKNTLPTDSSHIAENMENGDVQMSKNSLEEPVINSEIPDVLSVAVDAIQASLEKLKSDAGSVNNKKILKDPMKSQRRSSSENFRSRRQNSMEKGRKRKRRKSSSSAGQVMHSSDEDSLSIAELRSLNQQGVGKIMNIGVEPVHEITDCSQQNSYLNKTADLEGIQIEPNETISSLDSSQSRKSRSTKKIKSRAQGVADDLGDKVTEILESVVFGKNDELDTEPFSFMEYVENGVFVDEDTLPISKFGDPVFMKQFRRQRELFQNKKNTSNDLNSEADKVEISTMSHDVVPNNLPLQMISGKEFSNAVDDTEGKTLDEAAVGVDNICLNDKQISDGFIAKSLRRGRKREEITVPVFGRERSARITRWNLSYEEMYTSSDVGSETDSQEFDMTAPEETNDTLAHEPMRRTLPPRSSRLSSSRRNRRSNVRKSKNLKLHWASAKYRKMRSKRKRKTGSRGTDAKNETCLTSNLNSTSEDPQTPVESRPENGLEITKSVESHLEDVVEKEISEGPTVIEESAVRHSSDISIPEKEIEKESNIRNSDCSIPEEKMENSKDLSEASGKERVVSISENSKDLLEASEKERVVSISENSKDLLETSGEEMVVSISENSKDLLEPSVKETLASISLDVELADIQPNIQINRNTEKNATELVNPVQLKENNEVGSSSLGSSTPLCSNPENKSKEKISVAKYYCSSCRKNFATARNLRKHKETLFHLLQEKKRSSEDANNSLATGPEDCVEEVENSRAADQTSHDTVALVDGVNHVIGEAEQSLGGELITDSNRMDLERISKTDLLQEGNKVLVINANVKGNQCGKDHQLHPVESEILNTDRYSKRRRISSRRKDSNVDSMTSNQTMKDIETNDETVAVSGSLGSSVSHQDGTVASEPLPNDGKCQIEDCVEEVKNGHCTTDQTSHRVLALVNSVNHVIGEAEQSLNSELITDNNRMELESISKPDLFQEGNEVLVSNANMKGNQCGKDHQLHPVEFEISNTDHYSKRRQISSRRKDSNVDSITSNQTIKDIKTNYKTVAVSGSLGSSVSHQGGTMASEPLPNDGKCQIEDCVEEVEKGDCTTDQTFHGVLTLVDSVNHVIGEAEHSLNSELITDSNRMELKSISKPDLVQEGNEVLVSNVNMKRNKCEKDHQLHPMESEISNTDRYSKRRWISSRRKDSNVDSMTSNQTIKDIETNDETVAASGSLGSSVSHQDDTLASEPLPNDEKCQIEDCVEEAENGHCATDQTSHGVLALVNSVNRVIGEDEQSLNSELVLDNNRMELESISKPDLFQEGNEVLVSNANMKGNKCGKDHQLHPVESEILNTDRYSKRGQISSRRKDSMTSNKTTKDVKTNDETVTVSGSLGSSVSHQDDTMASEPSSSDGKCLLVNSSYHGGTSDGNQIEKCAIQELPAEPLDQTEKSLETISIVDTSVASSCKAIPGDLAGVALGWSLSEESMAVNDLALLAEESTPINTALADNYETFSSELVTQFSSVPSAPLEADSLDPEQIQNKENTWLGDQPLNPPAEQICWTDNLRNKEGEWCQDIVAKDTDLTEQQIQQQQEEQQTTSSTQPLTVTWTNGDSSQKEPWGDLQKIPEANWSEQQRANSTQWTEQNQSEIGSWPSVDQPAVENSNWTNTGDQQQPWPNADGPVVNWPAPDGWIGEPPRTWLWPSGNNTVEWGQQQNQPESTVCPWPTDPDSAQFYNQMEGNASLGTIMDTVNQVLHQEVLPPQSTSGSSEYPLYSYSEDATPSPAAPLASLRELQKAMGATDEEMVILQRLGERTLESNWPLENAEIIDLDKHHHGDAPTPPPPPPPPPPADLGAQKSNSDSDSTPAAKTPPPTSTSAPRKRNLPLRMVLGRNGRPKEYSPARDTSLMHEYQDKEMVCPLCHRFFLGLTALQTHVSSTHNRDETGKTQRVANRSRKTFSSLLSSSPNEPGTNSPRVLCPVCRELLQDEASLVRHREEMHNPCVSNDADAKDTSQVDENSKASSEGGGGEEPGAEGLKIKMTTALGDLFDRALSNLLEKGRLAGAAKDTASLNSLSLLQMTIKRSAGLDKKGSEGEAQPSTSRHNTALAKKGRHELQGRRRNSANNTGSEGKAPEVERPFACPVCDDRFLILSTRNRHIARAHNNRLTAVEDRSSASSPMSTMASTDDPSEEPTLDELDSAWREASPADWSVEPTEGDSEAGSFLCSDCGINFETPQDVLQHRKLEHSGRSEAVKDKLGTQELATDQGSVEPIKNIEDSIHLGRFHKMSQILSSVTKHLSEANEAKLKNVEAGNDSGTSSLSNEESSIQTAERCSSQDQPLQNNKTANVDVSAQLIKDLSTSKESVSDSGKDLSTVSDDHLSNLVESSKNDSNLKDKDGICEGKVIELSSSVEIPILGHPSESISAEKNAAAVNEKLDKDADVMASRVEKSLPTSTMKDNSAPKGTAAERTTKGTGRVGRGRSSARSLEKQMELCEDGTTIRAKAEAALRELNSRKNRSNTNPASKWGLKFTVSDSPKEKPPKKDGEGAQTDYPKKSATTDRFNFPLVRKLPIGSTRFASLAEKKKKVTNVSTVKKVIPVAEEDKMLGVGLESEVTKPQAAMAFDVYEFEDEDSVPVGELGFRPLHQRSSDERPKGIEGTDKSGESDPKSVMLDHTGEQQENSQDKMLKNNEELATEIAAEILEHRCDQSKSDKQAVPAEDSHHNQEPSHDVEKKEGKHEKSKESSKHKRSKKSSHEKIRRQSCHDEYLFGEHKIKSNEESHKSQFVPSDYINSEEDNDTTIKKSRKERGKKEHRKKKSHKRSEEHVHLSTDHSQKRKCEKDGSVKKQSKFKKSSESNDLEGTIHSESVPVEGGDSVSKKESRKHSKKRRLPSENSSDEMSDVALHESRRRTSSKHEHLKKRHKKRKHRYSMSSVSGFIEKHKTNYDSDDDNSLILSAKEVSSGRRYFVDDDDDETTICSSDKGEDSSEQTKRAAARRRRTKSDLLISVFAKSKRNCLINNSALRSKSFLTISSKDRDQTLSSSDESDVCDKRRSLNSSGHKNRTVSSSEVI